VYSSSPIISGASQFGNVTTRVADFSLKDVMNKCSEVPKSATFAKTSSDSLREANRIFGVYLKKSIKMENKK
jgi:hypothetical protein